MPRKFLKRIMPDNNTMREHPHLGRLAQWLSEPRLWHLNKRSVSGGVALGLFVAFIPVPGQMFIAAALAILLRVNLPLAVMGVWLTNPITMPPIFYFSYKLGAWLLDMPIRDYAFSLSWEWFTMEFQTIWKPFLLGSFVCGIVAAICGFFLVRLGWRLSVIYSWLKRRRKAKSRRGV